MTGILTSIITSFLQLVGQEAKAAARRRAEKERRARLAREKAIRDMERAKEKRRKAKEAYEKKQAQIKKELEAARAAWREHWIATRPDAREIPDNPYDEIE